MKRILALLLALAVLFVLTACSNNDTPQQPTETTGETEPVDTYPYPTINEKLTWERIDSLPKKSPDMTVQEMREACVEFMRFSKTVMWTPNANMHYVRNAKGIEDDMLMGIVYAGLPYVGLGTGNVYRMMDYLNEETGVMDMEHAIAYPKLFGNQCSGCTYWAWGRVINSTPASYTADMTHMNGFLRVGPYTYLDSYQRFSEQYSTKMICEDNGLETMCRSYAQLHLADGLVNYTTAGHVIMVSSEPHIAYYNDRIDPANSYITILEQSQKWEDYTNKAGDSAQVKNSVDKKMTFLELFNNAYIPFTYAEFLGTKGIDETRCSINLSGDSVEPVELFNAKVTANFGISDIYVRLQNDQGKEVYRLAVRSTKSGVRELNVIQSGTNSFSWGDYNKLSGTYAVEVSAQLSTGERPVLYTGKVTIE